jgi:hypothetical protein
MEGGAHARQPVENGPGYDQAALRRRVEIGGMTLADIAF